MCCVNPILSCYPVKKKSFHADCLLHPDEADAVQRDGRTEYRAALPPFELRPVLPGKLCDCYFELSYLMFNISGHR